jgi:hypothetical protein
MPFQRPQPTFDEIQECLERSGYLMESRLVRTLTELQPDDANDTHKHGYFVEPNQSIRDPRTGKSREIDIVADYYFWRPDHHKVAVKTTLVIEAINNAYPFILLTERPWTPNADFESNPKHIYTPDPCPFLDVIDLHELKAADSEFLFSQYCGLSVKNNKERELMASHPEDVYSSLLKLAEYIESEIVRWNSMDDRENDEYWRLFYWAPMLVLSGQLLRVLVDDGGKPQLGEIKFGRLEFNWHANDEPRTTVIEIVTEDFLLERLAQIRVRDRALEDAIRSIRLDREK